jgi:predicted enzyme related to lactoylglutathione lyase
MSTHETPWPAGTPCWVELTSGDPQAAGEFYRSLLGWDVETSGADLGHYVVARVHGHRVAGISGAQGDATPPGWTTYLASDDVAATARAVTDAGGQVVFGPTDVGDLGSMAMALDPTGASFGIWQSGSNTGLGLVNQPGGVVWNAQLSDDFERATAFYGTVFGLQAQPVPGVPEGVPTAMLARSGGQVVGSIAAHGAAMVPGLEQGGARWLTYFAVTDAEASAAEAPTLGGGVVHEPFDAPFGRAAVLAGPDGETFVVVQTPAEGYGHSDTPDEG